MILRPSFLRPLQTFGLARLNFSSKKPDELVFFNNDMVVCWHPEPKFPYSCSKPLPEIKTAAPQSILKITEDEVFKTFQREKPQATVAEELARMTYTTKHIWFPRARDKKAKKTPPNRPYL